jgi:hypothetical protein
MNHGMEIIPKKGRAFRTYYYIIKYGDDKGTKTLPDQSQFKINMKKIFIT